MGWLHNLSNFPVLWRMESFPVNNNAFNVLRTKYIYVSYYWDTYLTFSAKSFKEIIWFKFCFLIRNYPRHFKNKTGFRLFVQSDGVEGQHACQSSWITHGVHYTKTRNALENCPPLHSIRAPHWLSDTDDSNVLLRNTRIRATRLPARATIAYWMNVLTKVRGEFPPGRSLRLVGGSEPMMGPTAPPAAFSTRFRELSSEKRVFPLETVQNKYCKRQNTWIYNDGHYPLLTFGVFYIFVSDPLFLCNEINVSYVQIYKRGVGSQDAIVRETWYFCKAWKLHLLDAQ